MIRRCEIWLARAPVTWPHLPLWGPLWVNQLYQSVRFRRPHRKSQPTVRTLPGPPSAWLAATGIPRMLCILSPAQGQYFHPLFPRCFSQTKLPSFVLPIWFNQPEHFLILPMELCILYTDILQNHSKSTIINFNKGLQCYLVKLSNLRCLSIDSYEPFPTFKLQIW